QPQLLLLLRILSLSKETDDNENADGLIASVVVAVDVNGGGVRPDRINLLFRYSSAGAGFELQASRRKNVTRDSTSTLKAWLNEHKKNPYPSKGEKIMLAIITKMTLTQVSTWFANARRRLKKENKMTWEPRNKCDFDGDLGEDPQQPEGFHHHATAIGSEGLECSSATSHNGDSSSQSSHSPKPRPSKIWSLADTATKRHEQHLQQQQQQQQLQQQHPQHLHVGANWPPISTVDEHQRAAGGGPQQQPPNSILGTGASVGAGTPPQQPHHLGTHPQAMHHSPGISISEQWNEDGEIDSEHPLRSTMIGGNRFVS
ncbi:hypothetical protein BIW11_13042, partial [Tropilaelaps mercedesae]